MTKIAGDSKQIQNFRRKVEKHIQKDNEKITEEALKGIKQGIKDRLTKKTERIPLTSKTVTLFDENKHTAGVRSKFVRDLAAKIVEDLNK